MKTIFRIDCEIGPAFVEAVVEDLPFTPVAGMLIAPIDGADALTVEDVFWFAGQPGELEVWLIDTALTKPRPWSYWKAQGFAKGKAQGASA